MSIYICVSIIYMDIYIYHPWSILGVYKLVSPMSHLTIHCSHTNTMAGKGASSSTWKKKIQSKTEKIAKEAESAVSRMLKQILSQKV